jgi:hypothetical protein
MSYVEWYEDCTTAFVKLEETIKQRVEERVTNSKVSSPNRLVKPTITLKHIGVSMTYSWRDFIALKIPRLLESESHPVIELDIVFVEDAFLQTLHLDTTDVNWAYESNQRVVDVQNFSKRMQSKFGNRLIFKAATYRNIPHWHGWLVDDDHLYFGRTKWEFENERPKLTVGQNEYLVFDRSTRDGEERIELFKQWHKYYSKFGHSALEDG